MTGQIIDSKYVTVVLQGPTCRGDGQPENDLGLRAIQSIRQFLPEAEIIVSTWQKDSVEGFGDCFVVRSNDPGSMPDINGFANNINRQLLSTQAGVQLASRPYVLKMRADHALTSNKITSIQEYEPGLGVEYRLFNKPVTMSNLYIRKATKYPFLFHMSDLVQFGTKEDLLLIWGDELFRKEDVFLPEGKNNPLWGNYSGPTNLMHVPEQSLTIRLLNKKGFNIKLPYLSYINYDYVLLWEKILVINFNVLNWENSGVIFPSRFTNVFYALSTIYTEEDLANIRKKVVCGIYSPSYLYIWYNKYIAYSLSINGFVPLMASLLFKISPRLQAFVRVIWKKLMSTNR
ncbi:WavE lipopolysaccharide synthesis family protein [Agitococcus lubricus]|uniref:WavE lipopolysaccharide synthesis protein n=1 Tax=Agitococcus lubricus TaxID=1077255 RepID=A0A2T5J0W7_9GAMM|nr:WavE lipopolysaccharide synthesis family protein [Agitococcus lubricus]PTQ90038.1 WavE lipopolysaccharide synthesis protein [Agitococcus lubricus]